MDEQPVPLETLVGKVMVRLRNERIREEIKKVESEKKTIKENRRDTSS